MKRHGFSRIPVRRETLATRKLRARLAKERQGPDGKWETNQKKKEVWTAKRKCAKIGNAFEAWRSRQLSDNIAAQDAAKELVVKLAEVSKVAELASLLPPLQRLAVTADILCQSPSILDAFEGAAKRCRKSKTRQVARLLATWGRLRREGKTQPQLVMSDTQPTGDGMAPEACPVAVAEVPSPKPTARMLAPARPTKERPSMKLGSMFASMRQKRAAEEAETSDAAKQLVVELGDCSEAAVLRSLLPRLEGLAVTGALLNESPFISEALVAAAKRCRKSKELSKAVVALFSKWRDIKKLNEQKEKPPTKNISATKSSVAESSGSDSSSSSTSSSSSHAAGDSKKRGEAAVQMPSQKRKMPEAEVLPVETEAPKSLLGRPVVQKQRKITAMFGGSGLSTAGA